MPGDVPEILDANIVVLLTEPLPPTAEVIKRLEAGKVSSGLKKPWNFSQVVNVEGGRGAFAGVQIESMRSQKLVTFGPARFETHDLSGRLASSDLPRVVHQIATALDSGDVSGIGANVELTFDVQDGSAGGLILSKLLVQDLGFLPTNVSAQGGAARFFLERDSATKHVVAIEPRLNESATKTVWMHCNTYCQLSDAPYQPQYEAVFQQTYELLRHLAQSLFNRSVPSNP